MESALGGGVVPACRWLLDALVSNSGWLAALIREVNADWTADVVPDPDAVLVQAGDLVASADSTILGEWVTLARLLVDAGIPGTRLIDLR